MITKEERKIYNNQLRRTRKELRKLANEFRPYDSLWCIELLIGGIKGVRDYYANNVLVYAEDPQDMPSTLLKMLSIKCASWITRFCTGKSCFPIRTGASVRNG